MGTQPSRILRATLLALTIGACTQTRTAGGAENVIFFLGGGVGPTTATVMRVYEVSEARRLTMELLKHTARIRTHSNGAQTTDSAPSMLAYMTGVKVNDEVISISVDTEASDATGKGYMSGTDSTCPASNDTPAITLLELARAAGKSVSAVTAMHVTHAASAAAYSHICHHGGESQIAAQGAPGNVLYNTALKNGLGVLLGGGRRHYLPQGTTGSRRIDMTDLITQFQAANYTYVSTGVQLAAVNPVTTNKLLGLLDLDHMNYELDRVEKSIDEPGLANMTEKAIRMLQKNDKDYFLMMEDGRIDHALRGTNTKRTLEDAGAFDGAIKHALDTADPSNTLIVVTADHDHTVTINGYPRKDNPILGVSSDIRTGQPQLVADDLPYTTLMFGNGGTTRKTTRDNVTAVDTATDDYLQGVGVQLSTPGSETHDGGDVMLFSSGPGGVSLKGTLDSTKVFGMVETAMGL